MYILGTRINMVNNSMCFCEKKCEWNEDITVKQSEVYFLAFLKQKSFSTGIPLFLNFVFVKMDDTCFCGLNLAVHNTERHTAGSTRVQEDQ